MKRHHLLVLASTLAVLLGLTNAGILAQPAAEQASPASPATSAPPPTYLPAAPGEMQTIGMIAGVGWASSLEYYRMMNEKAQSDLGGNHSAKILMYSIEFGEFSRQERLASAGNWEPLDATLVDAGRRLKNGGADFIIIGSNTLNSRADLIEQATGLPVLRIYEVTGAAVQSSGLKTVALLGTKYTMDEPFYRDVLEKRYGVAVVTPNLTERDYINTVIFDELVRNDIRTSRGRSTSGSSTGSSTRRGPKGSSLAAPRSLCWCIRATWMSRCSIRRASMPRLRSTMPWGGVNCDPRGLRSKR
jgi:aspartate racemase